MHTLLKNEQCDTEHTSKKKRQSNNFYLSLLGRDKVQMNLEIHRPKKTPRVLVNEEKVRTVKSINTYSTLSVQGIPSLTLTLASVSGSPGFNPDSSQPLFYHFVFQSGRKIQLSIRCVCYWPLHGKDPSAIGNQD